jgi:hypothetical protein
MKITSIRSYFVHPSKNEQIQKEITSTNVPRSSQVFDMIETIFKKSETECLINIVFKPDKEEKQNNEFKDMLVDYATHDTMACGKKIASALQNVTTKRSSLGLLFIVHAKDGAKSKIMLSRFAAENGITASEDNNKLNVEYVENAFMRNALPYKSAIFSGTSCLKHIHGGKAVDKQMNGSADNIANYWISNFLQCSLQTTSASGTNRLAKRIKTAITEETDSQVKAEIIAAASLLKNVHSQPFSGKIFCEKYSLSTQATNAVANAFNSDVIFQESFIFSSSEFEKVLAYKSIELDNGAFISANAYDFNEIVKISPLGSDDGNDIVQVSTSGTIVSQKLIKAVR